MTVDQARKIVGATSDEALGKHFRISRAAVNYWRRKGIPSGRVAELKLHQMKRGGRKA